HRRGERRHENRPHDAEECLLVADFDVPPDDRSEHLAVVPELADVEVRPAWRRPDDERRSIAAGAALEGSRSRCGALEPFLLDLRHAPDANCAVRTAAVLPRQALTRRLRFHRRLRRWERVARLWRVPP